MTTHLLHVDDDLWEEYRGTISQNQRLAEPLLRLIVERVIDERGRGAVPTNVLDWYDGKSDTFPDGRYADA
jgi:hypothetical protein